MNDRQSEVSDEGLMLRYQRGDRTAFAALVGRYKAPVYNFVLRRLGSRELAEDLTQDAFLRVVRNATEFKHEARFSTWLFTIARNLCVDETRKRSLRRHPSLDAPAANDGAADKPLIERVADGHPSADVDRTTIGSEIQRRVVTAVENLPDEQREVFLLREIANLPFKEIAEVVGASENTVKSRMRYALDRLRQALSEFEEYAKALR